MSIIIAICAALRAVYEDELGPFGWPDSNRPPVSQSIDLLFDSASASNPIEFSHSTQLLDPEATEDARLHAVAGVRRDLDYRTD